MRIQQLIEERRAGAVGLPRALASPGDYKLMREPAPTPGPDTFRKEDYDIMLSLINYPPFVHEGLEEVHEQSDPRIE